MRDKQRTWDDETAEAEADLKIAEAEWERDYSTSHYADDVDVFS